MKDAMVPAAWSQVAVDHPRAGNTFRRGRCARTHHQGLRDGVPAGSSAPDPNSPTPRPAARPTRDRSSPARRLLTYWGWKGRLLTTEADARTFYDETCFMLAKQMAAPNSPQWFNTGLHWAVRHRGAPQGHYFVEPKSGDMTRSGSLTSARPRTPASSSTSPTTS